MTRQPLVARRAEELLGSAVVATAPVAGGDISTATRLRLSNGTTALMKTLPHAPDGFFAAEAAGLRWLAEASLDGGAHVPDVLGVDHECLIIRWVEPGKNSVDAATALGRSLAKRFHATYRSLAQPADLVSVDELDWHRKVHALRILVELAGWDAAGVRPASHPWLILEPITQQLLGLPVRPSA